MKISKMLSLLLAVLLPLTALAVQEGVVEQAPDVDLSTYTEWSTQSSYLPDAAMYADLMSFPVQATLTPQLSPMPTLMPRTTSMPMSDVEPAPTPAAVITEIREQDWCMVSPTPMPVDSESDLGIQAIENWTMVRPTPMPAEFATGSAFVLNNGTLFTAGEQDRIQHIQAERDAGHMRHPVDSDMVVLVPYGEQQSTDSIWFVCKADGSDMQTQSAAITLPGDMALCQVTPADYDGEGWYLMLPARELNENELLAVFDAFDQLDLTFDPDAVSIRNCSRGLGYNRALRAEEIERADQLSHLVYNDLLPGNIRTDGLRNRVLYIQDDSVFFLRPYSSMTDEELLQEVNIRNQDVMDKNTEREARELLNLYFNFPLSMACGHYIHGSDMLVVEGITEDTHQLLLKQTDKIIGAEFIPANSNGSFILVDVCFDDAIDGRAAFVRYISMPVGEEENNLSSVYRLETDEKFPALCAAANQFAGQYFGKQDLNDWHQATGDQLIYPHQAVPVKPYMTLYTYTEKALFVLTIEEDGTVREAVVHFFDKNTDRQSKMSEFSEKYKLMEVL